MSFVYSTLLGGSFDDYAAGIAADAAGNAYVTGFTSSGDFPLKNPAQATRADWEAFVTKIDPMGSSLVYSTYLGGSRYDAARAIAVDATGQAHVIGATMSADFPVVRPVRRLFGGGGWDAFVTKLSSDGGSFVYSTFLGGSGYDDGGGIAVDGGGDATVTGRTGSYDFPTVGAVQWSFAGGEEDAFVTKIVEDGPRPEPTPAPSPAASGGRFEQDDDRIAYSGGWYSNTTCGHSHGSAALSAEPGGSVTVPFDGTGIRWIGYRDEWSGTASVYLDGNFIETVDTYASPARFQAVLFSIEGLSPGTHTLAIHVDGSHGPDSAGSWVWVDALDVVGGPLGPSPEPSPTPTPTPTPPPVAGRTEESNLAAVSYGGAWYSHVGTEHSGGTAALSMEPGARAAFTFSGTGVRWVGLRDEWSGIASVFLDGVFTEAVDSYSSPEQFQAVLFSAEGLSPGTHTLVIEVTGSSGAASNGAWVWVDAFDVSDDPMASSGFP